MHKGSFTYCLTQAVYRQLINPLQELVSKLVPGVSFSFQYCMTDCEAAER
jgi:hypothetical protein